MQSTPSIPHPDLGILTPPDSPRKRRNVLRESEETEGYMSIEEYLLRSDPYRTTTMSNPWPHPVVERAVPHAVSQNILSHRERICRMLMLEGFPHEDNLRLFVNDITKPGYPGGNRSIRVLLVVYYNNVNAPRRLGPAKDEISALLRNNGIKNVHVEILFQDRYFRPSLFAIQPNHPAVGAYNSAREAIRTLLNTRLGRSWQFLSLLNVGLSKSKITPTIVVYVDPMTNANWSNLTAEVLIKLPPNDSPSISIGVEFLPGQTGLLLPQRPNHNGVSMADLMREDGVPVAGTSIGVPPERGGGSLGPFVTLRLNDRHWRGALTNYHVIQPPSSADANTIDRANRFGSSINSTDATHVHVSCFAQKDIEMTQYKLESEVAKTTDGLAVAKENREMRQNAGARVPASVTVLIQTEEARLSTLKNKLQVVKSMPTKLGRVAMSSGRRLIKNQVHDWAFITLEQAPFQHNGPNHRNTMPHVPLSQQPNKSISSPSLLLPEGIHLEEFGALTQGRWYCKVGRTTGLTAGVCNGVRADIQWPSVDQVRYDEKGKPVNAQLGITEEWIICSEGGWADERVQVDFCKPGDSGAGIISNDGLVCGLLYAATSGLAGSTNGTAIGIVMNMPVIRSAIEEKSGGGTLELP